MHKYYDMGIGYFFGFARFSINALFLFEDCISIQESESKVRAKYAIEPPKCSVCGCELHNKNSHLCENNMNNAGLCFKSTKTAHKPNSGWLISAHVGTFIT